MGWSGLDFFLRSVISNKKPDSKPRRIIHLDIDAFLAKPRPKWNAAQRREWAFSQRLAEAKRMDQQIEDEKKGRL